MGNVYCSELLVGVVCAVIYLQIFLISSIYMFLMLTEKSVIPINIQSSIKSLCPPTNLLRMMSPSVLGR